MSSGVTAGPRGGPRTTMNSRERILAALDHREADHVPLYFALMGRGEPYDPGYGFSFGNLNRFDARYPYSHRHQVRKAEQTLALGIDDTIRLEPPLGWAEEFRVEGVRGVDSLVTRPSSTEGSEGTLQKVYRTPSGELRTIVAAGEDWPHGDDVPLFSDFSVSRAREFLVKGRADVPRLTHLLGEPTPEAYREFKERAAELRAEARRLGVVFEGGRTALGDCLVWLMGIQAMIYAAYDDPGLVEELVDAVFAWERRRLEMVIDQGVEIVFHSAWYEITDFWTPERYRQVLKPRLAQLVTIAHQAGVKFAYIITKSHGALADDFLDLGFDCLYGVDPVQGQADLGALKRKLGGSMCLWGGVNSAVTLGRGTREDIERAVEDAIRTLAPGGGFVLFPVDNVLADANPWENTRVLLDAWRRIGSYPIRA